MKEKMKKIGKFLLNNIFGIIIGAVVFGGGVYAATLIASSNVTYNNSSSGASSTTVQGAIDELYSLSEKVSILNGYEFNSTKRIFANSMEVCINRNNKISCFEINNFEFEKNHMQQVFSGGICDGYSSDMFCGVGDFYCHVSSNGDVYCRDYSDNSDCYVYSNGSVLCD